MSSLRKAINTALDEARDNIRKPADEARNQIPRYIQLMNEYQEQNIQAVKEIADSYIESQRTRHGINLRTFMKLITCLLCCSSVENVLSLCECY
jgi:hypothetical protein